MSADSLDHLHHTLLTLPYSTVSFSYPIARGNAGEVSNIAPCAGFAQGGRLEYPLSEWASCYTIEIEDLAHPRLDM